MGAGSGKAEQGRLMDLSAAAGCGVAPRSTAHIGRGPYRVRNAAALLNQFITSIDPNTGSG